MIVAIDGPAASGKSTVARAVAERLGVVHLDTGAMYRAITWLALERGIPLDDHRALAELAEREPVGFVYAGQASVATGVLVAGRDVTREIRTPEVDARVSAVSAVPAVRDALVRAQRLFAEGRDVVAEGRDIGTTVFPHADVKVYLTASAQERARRRRIDLAEQGLSVEEAEVRDRLEARDALDSSREASPLQAAADAEPLDTTGLTIDEVVDAIAARIEAAR